MSGKHELNLPALAVTQPTAPMVVTPEPDEAKAQPVPKLNVGVGLQLQDWVSNNTNQDVFLVRDRSGSMNGQKLSELNMASMALGQVLGDETNKNAFRITVIDFSDDAEVRVNGEYAQSANIPEAVCGGGTHFDNAIIKTTQVIDELTNRPNPEGRRWLPPQVLFLSDGYSSVDDRNIAELQEVANVWAIAYGAGADQHTLARIASDGQIHIVGTRGGELRKLLADVGETIKMDFQNAS